MPVDVNIDKNLITFKVKTDIEKGFLEATIFSGLHNNDYVLFPAACYNGNKFDVLKKDYPPMFANDEASVDMPVTITDVPRLEKDGSGKIELTTGDVSVPCVGVFSKINQTGYLVFTAQQAYGHNLGLAYSNGEIKISCPAKRENIYRWPFMTDEKDIGTNFAKGHVIEIPCNIMEFKCNSLQEFYRVFFQNRKCMGIDDAHPQVLPYDKQFEIQKNKFNLMNWKEPAGFYGVNTDDSSTMLWQPGWVGGAMSSYALMKLGTPLETERAISTLHHLFNTQSPSGFFYESSDNFGNIGQAFHPDNAKYWCLIRKSADVLYFLFKHYDLMKERNINIPDKFIQGTKKLADAFVGLWQKYGQLGQFVNLQTCEIAAGGSTSGAIAPAGLVKAYKFFNNEQYLDIAKKAARQYYHRDLFNGYTTGGPGEILQCPDSESAFALLESFVVLYEETKETEWLDYAKDAAHLCSSWVMSYNYKFPKGSEFYRLGMKTIGSVFANAQNKHSAPGICTLSGDSLYRLYKWTNDELYLELLKDIALTISQYMSTDERPVYSWNLPKDPTLEENAGKKAECEKLPQGFICERVNTSDWEGMPCVGGVFNGSCWPEVSNLLTLAEVINLLN